MSCSNATSDTLAFRSYLQGLIPSVGIPRWMSMSLVNVSKWCSVLGIRGYMKSGRIKYLTFWLSFRLMEISVCCVEHSPRERTEKPNQWFIVGSTNRRRPTSASIGRRMVWFTWKASTDRVRHFWLMARIWWPHIRKILTQLKLKMIHYLNQLVGVLTEHLCIFLYFFLVAILGSFNQNQEGNVGLQERVGDVVHHSFAQLRSENWQKKADCWNNTLPAHTEEYLKHITWTIDAIQYLFGLNASTETFSCVQTSRWRAWWRLGGGINK